MVDPDDYSLLVQSPDDVQDITEIATNIVTYLKMPQAIIFPNRPQMDAGVGDIKAMIQ